MHRRRPEPWGGTPVPRGEPLLAAVQFITYTKSPEALIRKPDRGVRRGRGRPPHETREPDQGVRRGRGRPPHKTPEDGPEPWGGTPVPRGEPLLAAVQFITYTKSPEALIRKPDRGSGADEGVRPTLSASAVRKSLRAGNLLVVSFVWK